MKEWQVEMIALVGILVFALALPVLYFWLAYFTLPDQYREFEHVMGFGSPFAPGVIVFLPLMMVLIFFFVPGPEGRD